MGVSPVFSIQKENPDLLQAEIASKSAERGRFPLAGLQDHGNLMGVCGGSGVRCKVSRVVFWQREGNVNASSIMRFEDLLELWRNQHGQQSILEFLGIRSQSDVRGVEESDPGFVRTLCERLGGTWWEVTWLYPHGRRGSAGNICCRYLADSVKDAVRRCPGAQLPTGVSVDDDLLEEEADVPAREPYPRRHLATRTDD